MQADAVFKEIYQPSFLFPSPSFFLSKNLQNFTVDFLGKITFMWIVDSRATDLILPQLFC